MSAANPLFCVQQLRQLVGSRLLLDVSGLQIKRGDCIVLTGDNGSGKTTLLKALAGLERANHLMIEVDSHALKDRGARQWLREQTVYLHQQAYMFDRSVRQNISYGLVYGKGSANRVDAVVSAALDWSGLTPLAERNARHLSGGEKQRVALTRARIVEPVLLLLDEPTGGLDRRSKTQTYAMVEKLSNEGMTLIVSTHDDLAHFNFASVYWNIAHRTVQVANSPFSESVPS